MDFNATLTRIANQDLPARRRLAGSTLVEVLLSIVVGTIVMGTVASFSLFTAKNFATTANYVDLDTYSRLAVGKLSVRAGVPAPPTGRWPELPGTRREPPDLDGLELQKLVAPDRITCPSFSSRATAMCR